MNSAAGLLRWIAVLFNSPEGRPGDFILQAEIPMKRKSQTQPWSRETTPRLYLPTLYRVS